MIERPNNKTINEIEPRFEAKINNGHSAYEFLMHQIKPVTYSTFKAYATSIKYLIDLSKVRNLLTAEEENDLLQEIKFKRKNQKPHTIDINFKKYFLNLEKNIEFYLDDEHKILTIFLVPFMGYTHKSIYNLTLSDFILKKMTKGYIITTITDNFIDEKAILIENYGYVYEKIYNKLQKEFPSDKKLFQFSKDEKYNIELINNAIFKDIMNYVDDKQQQSIFPHNVKTTLKNIFSNDAKSPIKIM